VNFGIIEMMKLSVNWVTEVEGQCKKAVLDATTARDKIDEANKMFTATNTLTASTDFQEMTLKLELQTKIQETAFSELLSFQDLLSPNVNTTLTDLSTYTRVMDHIATHNTTSAKEMPANCVGMETGKPIVGKDFEGCAAACDRLSETCMGFTFFPSKICFLHRDIKSVTYYSKCQEQLLQDQSNTQNNFMRLSCNVKTEVFLKKYPNATTIKAEERNNMCPVYRDEGVNFTVPIQVSAEAFSKGTYIIDTAGSYTLTEDVDFNPNTPLSSGVSGADVKFPDPTSIKYPQKGGYFLGFFAAVAIAANDVTLDCQNHRIRMHPDFHKRQRFFSVIEVGSQPFIPQAGPPQFANTLLTTETLFTPKRVVIKNCRLGLSSHHGIHGNNAEEITIQDTMIQDFEVGGIHFNGASKVTITGCTVGPSLTATFGAQLSQATFIDHTMNTLLQWNRA